MKTLVDMLVAQGVVMRSLKPIDLRAMGVRKKIKAYCGVDIKNHYVFIFYSDKKSPLVAADIEELFEIYLVASSSFDHQFYSHYFVSLTAVAPKAKSLLQQNQWRLFEDEL